MQKKNEKKGDRKKEWVGEQNREVNLKEDNQRMSEHSTGASD